MIPPLPLTPLQTERSRQKGQGGDPRGRHLHRIEGGDDTPGGDYIVAAAAESKVPLTRPVEATFLEATILEATFPEAA